MSSPPSRPRDEPSALAGVVGALLGGLIGATLGGGSAFFGWPVVPAVVLVALLGAASGFVAGFHGGTAVIDFLLRALGGGR